MDPAVEAAWIGTITGGAGIISTAAVTIIGTRTTLKVAERTSKSGTGNTALALDAARADRLWDKRADAYIDALRFLYRKQALRSDQARALRFDDESENRLREWLASLTMPEDRQGVEMRLLAYASQPVLDALQASGGVNDGIDSARGRWDDPRQQLNTPGASPPGMSDTRDAFEATGGAGVAHLD